MAKNFLEALGRIALFRAKESSLGEAQESGGVSMDFDSGSGMSLSREIEDDREQIRGKELPTQIYFSFQTAQGRLSQKRVKPDFLTFVLGYFFGNLSSEEVSSGIFQHTITPNSSLYLPSFTLVQRRGDSILKERYCGNFIESFSLELGESWIGLSAELKGIGKREVNYFQEVVSAPANSTQITLSANRVEGDTEAERMENVFRVRAKDVGASFWTLCQVSGVSGDTPSVITLAQPVGTSSDLIDFYIDYIPQEPSWCEFPAPLDESPLRLVDAQVIVDGYFDGSEVQGGETISQDLLSFTIQGKNDLQIRPLADGSGEFWAGEVIRSSREITIKLSQRLRNTILQWQADHPETERISVYLKVRGAEIEPGSGYYFGADIIFPECAIIEAPISISDKFYAQEGDLLVMDDGTYSGVFIRTWNQATGYLS